VNINDSRVGFNGLIEYSNLNPWLEAGGKRCFYAPLYLPADDPRFAWSDGQWAEWWLSGLAKLFPDFDPSTATPVITRDAWAQAVCPPNFSRQVPGFAAPLPGLYLTDSTQLYPADRNISGMLDLARGCVAQCVASLA
jgi:protoporphyrinogen oxidase